MKFGLMKNKAFLALIIIAILVASFVALYPLAWHYELDQENCCDYFDYKMVNDDFEKDMYGQSFKVGGVTERFRFYPWFGAYLDFPYGAFSVHLYDDSGGKPNNLLDTETFNPTVYFPANTLDYPSQACYFDEELVVGDTYYVFYDFSQVGLSGNGHIRIPYNLGYAPGVGWLWKDGQSQPSQVSGGNDFLFKTYRYWYINEKPVAQFTYSPGNPEIGDTITFDGSSSYDTDGTVESYHWDFGDDETITTETSETTHSYTATGTYDVKLKVTDDYGDDSEIKEKSVVVGGTNTYTINVFTKDYEENVLSDVDVELTRQGETTKTGNSGDDGKVSFDVKEGAWSASGTVTIDGSDWEGTDVFVVSELCKDFDLYLEEVGGPGTAAVHITVYKPKTIEPIGGATVTINSVSKDTDEETGRVIFNLAKRQDYTIKVNKDGYDEAEKIIHVGEEDISTGHFIDLYKEGEDPDDGFGFDLMTIIWLIVAIVLLIVFIVVAAIAPIGMVGKMIIIIIGIILFVIILLFLFGIININIG